MTRDAPQKRPLNFWRITYVAALIAAIPALGIGQNAHAADPAVEALTVYDESSSLSVDNQIWTEFLQTYVVEGDDGINRLRYGSVTSADKLVLKAYIDNLEAIDPTALNREEQFAYWVNLYNAATIDVVLDHYPVDSIRAIRLSGPIFPGPWRKKILSVSGHELSLDMIEHEILRVKWSDPRIHYAVNCASIGCPNLAIVPYQGVTLDEQLETAARAYINHPRGAEVQEGRLTVSSIYDWFKEDFGNSDAGVIDHLNQYAEPDLKAALAGVDRIARDRYDWALNDATG